MKRSIYCTVAGSLLAITAVLLVRGPSKASEQPINASAIAMFMVFVAWQPGHHQVGIRQDQVDG